jgi:hypothetical protein
LKRVTCPAASDAAGYLLFSSLGEVLRSWPLLPRTVLLTLAVVGIHHVGPAQRQDGDAVLRVEEDR